MNPDPCREIDRIFQKALERKPAERARFLDEACASDASLRQEVDALIAAHEDAGSFIASPTAQAASDKNDSLVGRTIANYRVESLIGAGGMGEVYRAYDCQLQRDVAIKVLPKAFARDRERLARFRREAQVLASLNHAHIAAIYGLEEAGAVHGLVLEFVPGNTLVEIIANQRSHRPSKTAEELLQICAQIAEALEMAHSRGIVHRDLKPANIKVTPEGAVKVLDFGLAKVFDEQSDGQDEAASTVITADENLKIFGTPSYMSPEQITGTPRVDARTDVFSFGCLMYEMFSGQQAFHGESLAEILASVLTREPDFARLPHDLDPRISKLIRRCLEKDPRKRWQAVGDLRIELESVLTNPVNLQPEAAAGKVISRRRAATLLVQGAVVGVAAAGGMFWKLRSPALPKTTRLAFNLPENQEFTRAHRHVVDISPDGQTLVYVANNRLYRRRLTDFEPQPVAGTDEDPASPFFSPDGEWVGFWSGRDSSLKKISTSGGASIMLCAATLPFGATWHGNSIFFGQPGGLFVVSEVGGKSEVRIPLGSDEVAYSPQVLRNGDLILLTVAPKNGSWQKGARLVAYRPATGEKNVLLEGASAARYLSPGHLVYAKDANLLAVPFDIQNLRSTGSPFPVIEGVMRESFEGDAGGTNQAANYAVSQDGTLVYVPSSSSLVDRRQRVLALADRDGATTEVLGVPPARYNYPRLSPHGDQVAVQNEGNIFVYNLARHSSLRPLTLEGNVDFLAWSSDGQRIAFPSRRDGKQGIFWQRADGVGPPERLTTAMPDNFDSVQSFSRDTLAFATRHPGEVSIWTLPLHSGRQPELFEYQPEKNVFHAAFSPDGKWIAYTSDEHGKRQVYVQPYPKNGTKYQISRESGQSPVWSPHGTEIFYYQLEAKRLVSTRVRTQPAFEFEQPIPLGISGIVQEATFRQYDILPNGKQFLVLLPANRSETRPHGVQQINIVLNWFEELKHLGKK